jgi:hypothetical protein
MGNYTQFGDLLNHYLNQQQRSGNDLARYLGINPTTVMYWRNGDRCPRDPQHIYHIINFLHINSAEEQHTLFQAAGFDFIPFNQDPPSSTQSQNHFQTEIKGPIWGPVSTGSGNIYGTTYNHFHNSTREEIQALLQQFRDALEVAITQDSLPPTTVHVLELVHYAEAELFTAVPRSEVLIHYLKQAKTFLLENATTSTQIATLENLTIWLNQAMDRIKKLTS